MTFYNLLASVYYLSILIWDLEKNLVSSKWKAIGGSCCWTSISLCQFFFLCWNCENTIAAVYAL